MSSTGTSEIIREMDENERIRRSVGRTAAKCTGKHFACRNVFKTRVSWTPDR